MNEPREPSHRLRDLGDRAACAMLIGIVAWGLWLAVQSLDALPWWH